MKTDNIMLLSRFRLITFDVTNTLLKFRASPGKQYGEIGALYGIKSNESELTDNFKKAWVKMCSEHPNFGRHTGLGWQKWWQVMVTETFKNSNVVDEETLKQISSQLIDLYKVSSCWVICDGANDILSYVRSKDIPIGIISNFDPRLNATLTNMKLRHYFRFVLTSYETGFEKPDSRIFKEAMMVSKVKNLRPEECLHIGDQAGLDYKGAKSSGWEAVLINDSKDILKQYPHVNPSHIFNNLFKLHKHFVDNANEKLCSHSL